MLTNITHHGIFVLDQDEALDFYVNKLGLEVKADVPLGFMRWLTVGVRGEDREILLEIPGPPGMDERSAEQVRDLVTKGATGFAIGFRTDDCRKTFEELAGKGVDIVEEPTDRDYGIDFGIRDPFGNNIRIVQLKGMHS